MINDISFVIDGKLVVLIEHQSTINPNMALRLFMYAARIYEKLLAGRKLYSTKLIKIPQPRFFVLYNGKPSYPNKTILKLSDAFEDTDFLELSNKKTVPLELEVEVININEGKNEDIVKRCKTLYDYNTFITKVREFESLGKSIEESIKKTVKYCLKYDILKAFLEENAAEVTNMLMTEWNWDDAKDVWQEEAREEGIELGIKQGMQKGIKKGREEERKIIFELLSKGLSIDEIKRQIEKKDSDYISI
ncbi:MAG: Rpn family recombination-promoting nuclease/putative transposase [Treponema sp.]|nr:Rpn family recombination-promoting nuclease/putative transposase [Treponema sp.]